MLVLVRLFPKGGLSNFCNVFETEKRNLYWDDVKPLYALRQEGKRYVSVLLDVKKFEAVEKVFLKDMMAMASVSHTRTIPIMSPIYFPLPEGHPDNMERFLVSLRVEPDKYKSVHDGIVNTKTDGNAFINYVSYSFGDDDLIVSLLAKDRESARAFVDKNIGKIDGVNALDMSLVVRRLPMVPQNELKAHKDRFIHSAPAGEGGSLKNPDLFQKYSQEKDSITVIVRLFGKTKLADLWKEIDSEIKNIGSSNVIPLYASQPEKKNYISTVFEVSNFEDLKNFVVDDMQNMRSVSKTRTIPLLEPTYFLMPKEHPDNLFRFLITLRVLPKHYQAVRSKITGYSYPKNVFLTYVSYTLGDDDILVSVLAESRKAVQIFARMAFNDMDSVISYDISNQVATKRLASPEDWKKHQDRFLSNFDKHHKKDYDPRYDWTGFDWTDEFKEGAAQTGAFRSDL